MISKQTYIIFALFLGLLNCSEPYDFESISFSPAVVVSARLTNEMRQHEVLLSKAYPIDADSAEGVSGALVELYDQEGDAYTFIESSTGVYRSTLFAGVVGVEYQLRITLDNEVQIVSDWEELPAPIAIDDIYGEYAQDLVEKTGKIEGGIQFYLDVSNVGATPASFRYEWDETYQINPPYPSFYETRIDTVFDGEEMVVDTTVVLRSENVWECFEYGHSKSFITASTANNINNSLLEYPLKFVSETSDQLRTRYSLLVRQYHLSTNAYAYYKLLEENNTSGGFLIDKQAGTVNGNLSISSSELDVLGIFEVSSVDSLRKFFTPGNFFNTGFRAPNYSRVCSPNTESIDGSFSETALLVLSNNNFEITSTYSSPFYNKEGDLVGYENRAVIYPRSCSTCDWYADTNPPSYWEK